MRIAAGLLGVAVLGAIGVAVYLLVQLNQTETVLASTTASLQETTADLRETTAGLAETTGQLNAQTAENVELEAENGGLLEDKENLTAVKTTLEVSLAGSQAESGRLKVESAGLRQDLTDAGEQAQEQKTRYEKLNTEHADLDSLFETLRFQHSELQRASGTVDDLRTRAGNLRDEIEDLEERRRPLVLADDHIRGSRFGCTGSMEPVITCLDRPLWLLDFKPEDVVIGATISYDPDCWEDQANVVGTAHRVLNIEVRGGVYYYWPKGDANKKADGCWIPETSVRGYLIDIEKNVRMENAALRDAVNGAKAARDARRVESENARAAYLDVIERYCGHRVPGECYLDPGPYAVADAAYYRYDAAYEKYDAAWNLWDCWYDNALKSEYPGHIPHACPRIGTGPSPILPTA